MRKILLALLPCLSLLLSCSVTTSNEGESSEGSIEESCSESVSESSFDEPRTRYVFNASSLPETPIEEERNATIDGFDFTYCNVYKDSENGFVLKNKDSYIRNTTIIFGLLFHSELAAASRLDAAEGGIEEHELRYEQEGLRSYSIIPRGFEITIDKSLSAEYADVNIGTIEHWC